ncbi:hypothetical protein OJF2_70650 [Aquisphaera giovannonii]|uniref:Uncharacterized protein n=1 Tax=Aquisphaera giovannonii TaxID=406548 RepID=A0A5B9WD16_9BACT|nr:hypothetical protein [Aquisphaera giovannonii]QEH38462.1 hypothetical protein OJF2_70650 [Aquisphaera giovannonii]
MTTTIVSQVAFAITAVLFVVEHPQDAGRVRQDARASVPRITKRPVIQAPGNDVKKIIRIEGENLGNCAFAIVTFRNKSTNRPTFAAFEAKHDGQDVVLATISDDKPRLPVRFFEDRQVRMTPEQEDEPTAVWLLDAEGKALAVSTGPGDVGTTIPPSRQEPLPPPKNPYKS